MSSRSIRPRSPLAINPDLLPDLYHYAAQPAPALGRPVKHDPSGWSIIDDWPAHVPVSEREVDVFEAWFGDILDELFGPI